MRKTILAGSLAVAAVAACVACLPMAEAGAGPAIAWGACPSQSSQETCGTVTVPLDHRHPRGRTITIAVSKLATAKPGHRRGFLLLNPGGPALGGLTMPSQMAAQLPKEVLDTYDLIGFDPRGVGHSTPQSCGLSSVNYAAAFPYPGADGSIEHNVGAARRTAAECAAAGPDLRHFTTANTARDLDLVRQALGAPKISYWGQSYGTYLGAVYASLFPRHTDRIVLEGNVDPNLVWQGQQQAWSQGMADRFPDAAKVAAEAGLGLGRTPEEVTRTYLALADRLDRTPAAVPGSPVPLDGVVLRGVTYQLLMRNDTLPLLTRFWRTAATLSSGGAPAETDLAVLRQVFADSREEPGVPADNMITMTLALMCGDASWSRDVAGYARAAQADRGRFPLTAGMPANIWPCAFWPQPAGPRVKVTSQGPRNALVLQNRRDHATPWETGLGMRRALGGRAVFVGADNGGHYVYGTGNACADRATDAFLTRGALPAKDLRCR
ncbi:alpha/beta hydrolase fold [Lentzea fradiae]|uniref:Alpha/beta hydrolase fold n=1 Tax=Lentzea fradiae TaxID=200378 RepID=A0A1G7L3N8_9PSEU|nr:alpha/beta hydrolase [Lentzea fradiae]SDF44162.1 alpha/beta hydrolase fold [Lentzea fradiae]